MRQAKAVAESRILFLTELLGLPVFDTKQRRIGRVKDAAIVPRVDRDRVDRYLVGGGWAWLTVRHDRCAPSASTASSSTTNN